MKRHLVQSPRSPGSHHYYKFVIPFILITIAALFIAFYGPHLVGFTGEGHHPLAAWEKRFYVIAFLYLAWLLGFLLSDLYTLKPLQYPQPALQRALTDLQQRFDGAVRFLKKTALRRHKSSHQHNPRYTLNELPWYLLIGASEAGKTALLSHSGVHFTLQKQSPSTRLPHAQCDWWVTRDFTLIDVPGHYLEPQQEAASTPHLPQAALFTFLLQLIKKQRGRDQKGLAGIVIALPLAEWMQKEDNKPLQTLGKHLADRLKEVQTLFHTTLPCHFILTKCDLLTGFTDFFAESSEEEAKQAWGITLPALKAGETIRPILNNQFDALIRKINQQLLWRLHHERNSQRRPFIKEFPLQLERLKEQLADFLQALTATGCCAPQSVYLTSALQKETHATLLPAASTSVIASSAAPSIDSHLTLSLTEAPLRSQPYFINHILAHKLLLAQRPVPRAFTRHLVHTGVYGLAGAAVVSSALYLGYDFKVGMAHTYAISDDFSTYQFNLQSALTPTERIVNTLHLLNQLKAAMSPSRPFILDIPHLLSYYSNQSNEKSRQAYIRALQTILIPQIQAYLSTSLTLPVNRNENDLYETLTAYVMLGDHTHYDPAYIVETLNHLLPHDLTIAQKNQWLAHASFALAQLSQPLTLDVSHVNEARQYLNALPSLQLSYLILQNIGQNTGQNHMESAIHLTVSPSTAPIFDLGSDTPTNMFTAPWFTTVLNQDATQAALEALQGNWVLGAETRNDTTQNNTAPTTQLTEQLRSTYINNYVHVWEQWMTALHLVNPTNLQEIDHLLSALTSDHSPLLHLLQIVHDNTYFNPIAASSVTLQQLGELVDNQAQSGTTKLNQIISALDALHQSLQPMLAAHNEQQAAYQIVANMMQHRDNDHDPLIQLRLVAAEAPFPLNNWLNKLANTTWTYLMQDASHYMNVSLQAMPASVNISNINTKRTTHDTTNPYTGLS